MGFNVATLRKSVREGLPFLTSEKISSNLARSAQ